MKIAIQLKISYTYLTYDLQLAQSEKADYTSIN